MSVSFLLRSTISAFSEGIQCQCQSSTLSSSALGLHTIYKYLSRKLPIILFYAHFHWVICLRLYTYNLYKQAEIFVFFGLVSESRHHTASFEKRQAKATDPDFRMKEKIVINITLGQIHSIFSVWSQSMSSFPCMRSLTFLCNFFFHGWRMTSFTHFFLQTHCGVLSADAHIRPFVLESFYNTTS